MAKSKVVSKTKNAAIAIGGIVIVGGLIYYLISNRKNLSSKLSGIAFGSGGSSASDILDGENSDSLIPSLRHSADNPSGNPDEGSLVEKIFDAVPTVPFARNVDRQSNVLNNLNRNQIFNLREYLRLPASQRTNAELNNAVQAVQNTPGFRLARSVTGTGNAQATATFLATRSSFDRIARINNTDVGHSGFREVTRNTTPVPSSSITARISRFLTQNRNQNRRTSSSSVSRNTSRSGSARSTTGNPAPATTARSSSGSRVSRFLTENRNQNRRTSSSTSRNNSSRTSSRGTGRTRTTRRPTPTTPSTRRRPSRSRPTRFGR